MLRILLPAMNHLDFPKNATAGCCGTVGGYRIGRGEEFFETFLKKKSQLKGLSRFTDQ
jgi:hypothetical protein